MLFADRGRRYAQRKLTAQRVVLSEMQCACCFSIHLKIIDSYETREVVVCCLDCGRFSELDTENQNVEMTAESSSGWSL